MKKRIFTAIIMVCWAVVSVSQNDVGIGTNNPAARLDVRGNGIGYDVFNASNDKALPLDSIFVIDSVGHVGIGTADVGAFNLLSIGLPSAFSPQIEVWNGDPNNSASRMLGDIVDVGAPAFNGAFGLYLNGNKNVDLRAFGNSYFNGGRVGIGVTSPAALLDVSGQGTGLAGDIFWAGNDQNATLDSSMVLTKDGDMGIGIRNPLERLHVNGAMLLGNTANNNIGTIRWNGANFQGLNNVGWINLDVQTPWILQVNNPVGNPELVSGAQPLSLSFAFPAIPNALARLYVTDMSAPGIFPHQLAIETITGNALPPVLPLDASQLYRISSGMNPPNIDFSVGIFGQDGTYKVCLGPVLTATAQSDNTTMLRANPSGIIDLANQSRVRAYQLDPSGANYQLIPPNFWIPVNFTDDITIPQGYDEQNEFALAGAVSLPAFPPAPIVENAYFMAQEDGYYQVNARCEFNTDYCEPDAEYGWPGGMVGVNADSYVSIAIWTGTAPGATASYAIGNNLQIGYMYTYEHVIIQGIPPEYYFIYEEVVKYSKLKNNNAPNVSDVIWLKKNEIISIWVYHTATTPMNLIQGPDKLYVSIHKVS